MVVKRRKAMANAFIVDTPEKAALYGLKGTMSDNYHKGPAAASMGTALTAPARRVRKSDIYEATGTITLGKTAIRICQGYASTALVDRIIAELDDAVWEQPEILMFGRRHRIPRYQTAFGTGEYTYSGLTIAASTTPPAIAILVSMLEEETSQKFHFVLGNRYDTGEHSISYHADDEKDIVPGSTIASFSLGTTRRFMLRRTQDPSGNKIEIPSGHNTLILMGGACQKDFQHQVPKEPGVTGRRYNLTFRMSV